MKRFNILTLLLCCCFHLSLIAQQVNISHQLVSSDDDWAQAMLKTQQAFQRYQAQVSFEMNYSPVMGINDDPYDINVDLSECDNLVLQADESTDNNVHDGAIFANAFLIDKSGNKHFLDKMSFIRQVDAKGKLDVISPEDDEIIYIGNNELERGVGVYAPGEMILDLGKKFKSFHAKVGTHRKRSGVRATVQLHVKNYSSSVIFESLSEMHSEQMSTFLKYSGRDAEKWLWAEPQVFEKNMVRNVVDKLEQKEYFLKRLSKNENDTKALLNLFLEVVRVYEFQEEHLKFFKLSAVQESVEYLKKNNKDTYRFDQVEEQYNELMASYDKAKAKVYQNNQEARKEIIRLKKLKREILLENPFLKDDFIAVRHRLKNARTAQSRNLGTPPSNFSSHGSIKNISTAYDTEIIKLSDITTGKTQISSVYKPKKGELVNDLELHYDADKLMFSKPGNNGRWHLHEMNLKDGKVNQLTPDTEPDLDYHEGLYLPNGKIICASNIGMQAVPCVNGKDPVANLCLFDPESKDFKQLNYGQDNEWDPVMLHNGRVMYLRWEYTDETHYFTRILMHMNPDGTGKKEYYGSGSYWPNSLFYAKPLPNHPTKFVGIVTGHHGIARAGRLVVFDPQQGRFEADGVVQEIPYKGREVVPEIKDHLVKGVWPLFTTPYPVDDNYFVVTAKMNPDALWGVYLVDMFDNVTLIHEFEDSGIREILPLKKKKKPIDIPDKTIKGEKEATIYIQDLYEGKGTQGVPKGKIKSLRVFAYKFGFNQMLSNHDIHGIESAWDVKRVLGTVPVEEDGSVMFKVPANTPISLQPLDEKGRAIQLMRSWLTAMPGEVLSCVGCHEDQNQVVKPKYTLASRKKPVEIMPMSGGGARPFSFDLEVQPVLDRNCISCHNGNNNEIPDFASDKKATDYNNFRESYLNLHPYISRPGPESDVHILTPMEFHASTSELVQLLESGHHGVELEDHEWEKLNTWIDLNVPYHGKWRDVTEYRGFNQEERRKVLAEKYNNLYDNSDEELLQREKYLKETPLNKPEWIVEKEQEAIVKKKKLKNWPFDTKKASSMQLKNLASTARKVVKLNDSISMTFVRIPAGQYLRDGKAVKIAQSFWMSTTELTNAQYRTLHPEYVSRMIDQHWKDHTGLGYEANKDEQPVIRLSWEEAMQFANDLTDNFEYLFDLPTEDEWEWACLSGSDTGWSYGEENSFAKYANLADETLREMTVAGVNPKPMPEYHPKFKYNNFLPRAWGVDDGSLIQVDVAQYKPNAWGLYDMHGNVKEWTKTNHTLSGDKKRVKGGSWKDRPLRAKAFFSIPFSSWQKVPDVGVRLIIREK
ncbi:HzsA-related protein [Aureibacter tunicatorum]|uniref:Formylglycine-generating enzyme required for sulfatase activity n=1 Tax=Aureibacter tunicatorum TaxID=866807 RepID=A0AAE3XS56_9BACT|nr:SUMF1/EgtB/PvdO family nonheme iron enzyme [Aureibacter tunicatorum]MDR6241773.1 formylglycine-generating enzyme required for sulfatase activity [Aureibacter tunicatorum]BDD07435.1 hypothetical protein AUTU_49180 [Aureibacter tunicatorum]